MGNNTFGHLFQLHSFGESHGKAIGGIIDGCPSGFDIDLKAIQNELNRRRPGQSSITTQRKETDSVEFLSGIFEGKTLGTPIAFVIYNHDAKSSDYDALKGVYRPNHADYTYDIKYGIRDHRGGGRASARETVARVVAGALARQILTVKYHITIQAYVAGIGNYQIQDFSKVYSKEVIESNAFRCPNQALVQQIEPYFQQLMKDGDTVGGKIYCAIHNVPVGIGSPVFEKLNARLAHAMLGINAVKSFQLGSDEDVSTQHGSNFNDIFKAHEQLVSTQTNRSAGIQGGISNGSTIDFLIGFKPVASIKRTQETINSNKENTSITIEGRHDPCVVPRAVPIVESMAALVILDEILKQESVQFKP